MTLPPQMRHESEERERQEKVEAEEKALRAQRQAEWVCSCKALVSQCNQCYLIVLSTGLPPLTGQERGAGDARDAVYASQKLPHATRHAHTDRGTH